MEKLLNNRYAILVVGVVTMLMYGIIYAWSIFIPPLEAEFGWSRASTSLVFSVAMIALSVGMTCVGQLAKHMPLRRVFLLGGLLVVAGLVCCRFVTQPWHLYLLYGVLCGFGVGLAYTSWTTSVLAWFGDRAGFASGFLVMGFGMGTVVLGAVATLLIYSALGWRWAFTIIGASVFAWSLLACAFMRTPPQKWPRCAPNAATRGCHWRASRSRRVRRFGSSARGAAFSWARSRPSSPKRP